MKIRESLLIILFFFLNIFIYTNIKTALLYSLFLLFIILLINKIEKFFYEPKNFSRFERQIINAIIGFGVFQFIWLIFSFFSGGITKTLLIFFLLITLLFFIKNKEEKTKRDEIKLNLFILIFLSLFMFLILYPPFSQLGKPTSRGIAYRAYFSSDYLKHYSVIRVLSDYKIPPPNPYFYGEKLHYYWVPYSIPSTIFPITKNIKYTTIGWSVISNLIFLILLFYFTLNYFSSDKYKLLKTSFWSISAILFVSYEGLFLIFRKGLSNITDIFRISRNYNIDALTRWLWHIPEVNTLLRSLFYTPQHLFSLTFLLLYLHLKKKNRLKNSTVNLLLASSLVSSIFIGLGFLIIILFDYFFKLFKEENKARIIKESIITITLSLFLFFFFYLLKIIVLGERNIFIKIIPIKLWLGFFILNFGLFFFLSIPTLIKNFKKNSNLLSVITLTSIILIFRIEGFESDISLKFSLVLFLLLFLSSLEFIASFGEKKPIFHLILILLLLPSVLTSIIDIKNSSDISNKNFTFYIPKEEFIMLRWIDKNIPKSKVIQTYPPVRAPFVSIIPSFTGCQMYVGDKMHGRIFLVKEKLYKDRINRLTFLLNNPEDLKNKCNNIDYLFWGLKEGNYFHKIPKLKVIKKIKKVFLFKIKE